MNNNIGLCGEYRVTVIDNDYVVKDTGWCKNTILSGGLASLRTTSILTNLDLANLGTSTSSSGNFTLSGILGQPVNTELLNIPVLNREYFTIADDTQGYYARYISNPISTSPETINEFSVKSNIGSSSFARAVFQTPISLDLGQRVSLEYRLSVKFITSLNTTCTFTDYFNNTFYVPVTSTLYRLPNFNVIENENTGKVSDSFPLRLLENTDTLPVLGDIYPKDGVYSIDNKEVESTFYPTSSYGYVDGSSNIYHIVSEYAGLSVGENKGIYSNINTLVLYDKDGGFYASRLKFPLVLYNLLVPDSTPELPTTPTILYSILASLSWGTGNPDVITDLYGKVLDTTVYKGLTSGNNLTYSTTYTAVPAPEPPAPPSYIPLDVYQNSWNSVSGSFTIYNPNTISIPLCVFDYDGGIYLNNTLLHYVGFTLSATSAITISISAEPPINTTNVEISSDLVNFPSKDLYMDSSGAWYTDP